MTTRVNVYVFFRSPPHDRTQPYRNVRPYKTPFVLRSCTGQGDEAGGAGGACRKQGQQKEQRKPRRFPRHSTTINRIRCVWNLINLNFWRNSEAKKGRRDATSSLRTCVLIPPTRLVTDTSSSKPLINYGNFSVQCVWDLMAWRACGCASGDRKEQFSLYICV